jgi:hypothetical protein
VRVSEDQGEKCARAGDWPVGFFVFGTFAIQKQLVLFEKQLTKFAEEFPALGGYGLSRHHKAIVPPGKF